MNKPIETIAKRLPEVGGPILDAAAEIDAVSDEIADAQALLERLFIARHTLRTRLADRVATQWTPEDIERAA